MKSKIILGIFSVMIAAGVIFMLNGCSCAQNAMNDASQSLTDQATKSAEEALKS